LFPHQISFLLPETAGMVKERTGYGKGDLVALGNLFSGVYSAKKWTSQWRLFRLVRDWPAIVGVEVARLTSPAFFRREILWIHVQDSAWMHHLQFVKTDLLTRINRSLDEQPIADIRWQLQTQPPSQPERYLAPPHAVDGEQEQSFCRMTESIANQECREALQRLWRTFAAHSE
jgi:hypothetical protein